MFKQYTVVALLICMSQWSSNAWSANCTCTFIGDIGSQVTINNTVKTLSRGDIPLRVTDCQTITVKQGAVDLCQTGKSCTRYSPAPATPYTPCANSSDESGAWDRMHAMLKGNLQEKTGGKLLDEAGEAPGFPAGDVLMPHKALKIPLNATAFPNGINSFTLINEDTGQTVLQTGTLHKQINISNKHLKPGQGYLWQAKIGRTIHEGSFLILAKFDALEVEALVQKYMGNIKKQSVAELFIRAAAYDEFDLQFDRNQMLSEYHQKTH